MTLSELLRLDAQVLKGFPGVVQDLNQAADALEKMKSELKDFQDNLNVKRMLELEKLSVTNIMLDVVPGDGSGLEVYAKSVAEVEQKLSDMGSELEDWQLGIKRHPVQPSQAHVAEIEHDAAGRVAWLENPFKLERGTRLYTHSVVQPSQAPYDYDKTFSAIAKAAQYRAGALHISCKAFWDEYGISADQPSQALDDKQKLEIVSDWFSDKDMQSRAMQMLGDIEQATEKLNKNDTPT